MDWRFIPDVESLYMVSEYGDILSIRSGRLLKFDMAKGYKRVTLNIHGRRVRETVHRIVARTFLGPAPDGKNLVLHADDDPLNNHYSNLRWGTPSDNTRDAVANRKHRNSKKTHCPSGHEYTPENTLLKANGWRICRECNKFFCLRGKARRNGGDLYR